MLAKEWIRYTPKAFRELMFSAQAPKTTPSFAAILEAKTKRLELPHTDADLSVYEWFLAHENPHSSLTHSSMSLWNAQQVKEWAEAFVRENPSLQMNPEPQGPGFLLSPFHRSEGAGFEWRWHTSPKTAVAIELGGDQAPRLLYFHVASGVSLTLKFKNASGGFSQDYPTPLWVHFKLEPGAQVYVSHNQQVASSAPQAFYVSSELGAAARLFWFHEFDCPQGLYERYQWDALLHGARAQAGFWQASRLEGLSHLAVSYTHLRAHE
ncbi:MAG: hypothetical protein N2Z70_06400, partial [Bdellovibrionaceae bacterium]|nr:hypothetical protein [Pseudobdellovibrionaceae bacterium]